MPAIEQAIGLVGNGLPDLGPRRERRKYGAKAIARRRKLIETQPLTPEDVPPGSVMAESTMAAIAAGQYVVNTYRAPINEAHSRRPLRKRKQQMAKANRKANRARR